jgi:hypothetical protein
VANNVTGYTLGNFGGFKQVGHRVAYAVKCEARIKPRIPLQFGKPLAQQIAVPRVAQRSLTTDARSIEHELHDLADQHRIGFLPVSRLLECAVDRVDFPPVAVTGAEACGTDPLAPLLIKG